jgi:hypothetical protein
MRGIPLDDLDTIADPRPCFTQNSGGHFEHASRPPDERADLRMSHRVNQVDDLTALIEKHNVNGKAHPKRMDAFRADQEQTFAVCQGRATNETAQARLIGSGDAASFDQNLLASSIDGLHTFAFLL